MQTPFPSICHGKNVGNGVRWGTSTTAMVGGARSSDLVSGSLVASLLYAYFSRSRTPASGSESRSQVQPLGNKD